MIDDRVESSVQELLAANLRRLRIARHLSLSELARATVMSKATLSGIENARANPTVETLAALAAALRVSMAELLAEPTLGEIRIVRAAQGAARDGSSQRLLDAIEPPGGIELAEIALNARQLRDMEPGPEGTRASVYVL